MKRLLVFLLLFVLILSANAYADTIVIDLDTINYDELVEAIALLNSVRKEMLIEQFRNSYTIEPKNGIVFRDIPWHTTKEDAELKLGKADSYNYSAISTTNSHNSGIGGGYGFDAWYNKVPITVAGYSATLARYSYVYPVVDGILIRDDDFAVFYMGYYNINDLGDVSAAVNDLADKLNKLYGEYVYDEKYTWTDTEGNTIALWPLADSIVIKYWASDADKLIDAAKEASDTEKAQQEELQRIQNQTNIDGL